MSFSRFMAKCLWKGRSCIGPPPAAPPEAEVKLLVAVRPAAVPPAPHNDRDVVLAFVVIIERAKVQVDEVMLADVVPDAGCKAEPVVWPLPVPAAAPLPPLPLSQCLWNLFGSLGRRPKPRIGTRKPLVRVENFRYVWLTLQWQIVN